MQIDNGVSLKFNGATTNGKFELYQGNGTQNRIKGGGNIDM